MERSRQSKMERQVKKRGRRKRMKKRTILSIYTFNLSSRSTEFPLKIELTCVCYRLG